jgi:hypothetical protein
VSLILDALKKVEREKDAREPGVLVVGSVPWGARTRSYRPLALALAGAGLAALLAWAVWPRDRAPRPATVPSSSDSSPAPAPTPKTAAVRALTAPSPAPAVSPPEPRRLSVPSSAAEPAEVPSPDRALTTDDSPASAPLPPAAIPAAKDDLRLNAISQRDGRPLALINDRLVFEGDSFDGVKILRIGEAEVEVEVRGKRRVLRF